jgi:hypothetical protein
MSHLRFLDRVVSGAADPAVVMFYGPDGAEIRQAGLSLVRYWLKAKPEADLERHVDFQLIKPFGAGSQIKIQAIKRVRQAEDEKEFLGTPLIEFFRTPPLMGPKKVIWFEDCDRMSPVAANALLKALEEIGGHARVVMTTSNRAKVLPTIRSRSLCVAAGFEVGDRDLAASAVERVWGSTPGLVAIIRTNQPVFEELHELLDGIGVAPRSASIMFGESALRIAGEMSKFLGVGHRESQVFLLECVGRWWLTRYPDKPETAIVCAQVSREILSFANAQIGFESVFGTMLAQVREPGVLSHG